MNQLTIQLPNYVYLIPSFKETERLIMKAIAEANDKIKAEHPGVTTKTSIRKGVAYEYKVYEWGDKILKAAHLDVMKCILRMFYGHIRECQKRSITDAPFTFNNAAVRTQRGRFCNVKTAQRHINRLIAAGLLIEELQDRCMRKKEFLIQIKPSLLVAEPNPEITNFIVNKYKENTPIPDMEVMKWLYNATPSFSGISNGCTRTICIVNVSSNLFQELKHKMECGIVDFKLSLAINEKSIDLFQEHGNKDEAVVTFPPTVISMTESPVFTGGSGRTKKQPKITDSSIDEALQSLRKTAEEVEQIKDAKKLEKIVYRAWVFAYYMLWDNKPFSAWQIEAAKRDITQFFIPIAKHVRPDYSVLFRIFTERCMLKYYNMKNNPDSFVPNPNLYFDRKISYGFVSTKAIYDNMCKRRRKEKEYRSNMTLLSECIACFSCSPTIPNYKKGERLLAEKKDSKLLMIYNDLCFFMTKNY